MCLGIELYKMYGLFFLINGFFKLIPYFLNAYFSFLYVQILIYMLYYVLNVCASNLYIEIKPNLFVDQGTTKQLIQLHLLATKIIFLKI